MQKTLALLERNVEWIALALGGLFVLWAAYAYVYTPPATVRVGPTVLGPGDVSDYTFEKLAKAGKQQIDATNNFKPIEVPQVVAAWEKQMSLPKPVPVLDRLVFNSPVSTGPGEVIVKNGPLGAFQVNALAQLPKVELQPAQSGLSMIVLPGPGGQKATAQPVANVNNEDLAWVSLSGVVPAKALQEAFAAPLAGQNINDPNVMAQLEKLYKTAFLEVQLQRQRATGEANGQPVFPNGNQGIETVTPPRIQKDDLEPMPDEKANAGAKASFVNWAEGHLDVITQPKFYDVKGGDIWNSPIAAPGAKNAPGAAPGARAPALNPPPLVPNPNGAPVPGNAPPGVINPLNVQSDYVIWAHDETGKPGETYRYRLIYHMKNPVIDEQGIASTKIINALDIASPPSDWSAPVVIPRKTMFWVSNVNRNGTVQMDVFQYAQGQWQKTTSAPLYPGDQVPTTDLAIVDVHVGGGGMHDKYVLVADADGDIRRHSASERADAKYKEMLDLVNRPAAPAGTAVRGGVPGGAPPPPPPPLPRRTAARGG